MPDVSKAVEKIDNIVSTIDRYKTKMEEIRDTYVTKINGYIQDLEDTINGAIDKINNGSASAAIWLEKRVTAIVEKIQRTLDNLKSALDSIIKQVEEWYNETVTNVKVSVATVALGKVGITEEAIINAAAEAIPHPDIKSLIPDIKIELQLPELNLNNLGVEKISIPKIEI